MPATASTTPFSTYGVKLKVKGSSGYEPLCDITSFPQIGGAPETLDCTTLSDSMTKFILGIQQLEAMSFTANLIKSDYDKIKAMRNTLKSFAIFFGNEGEGENGKFYWDGYIDVFIDGKGVNEVNTMTITIAPTSEITETAKTT